MGTRERRALPQEMAARAMEQTEQRMHSSADHLDEPTRTQLHKRADEVSRRAERRMAKAREARSDG